MTGWVRPPIANYQHHATDGAVLSDAVRARIGLLSAARALAYDDTAAAAVGLDWRVDA